jgi:hypothetical protein
MDVKRLAAAARIAVGVGIAALLGGTAQVSAAPLDQPPPCPDCPADPGGPPPAPVPFHPYNPPPPVMRQGPGGPKGGGGVPVYEEPKPVHPYTPGPSPTPDP